MLEIAFHGSVKLNGGLHNTCFLLHHAASISPRYSQTACSLSNQLEINIGCQDAIIARPGQ